jgi:hypothetical protein
MAVLMLVLLAIVTFVVDIGYVAVARSEAQNTADAAALAGMSKLAERLKSARIVGGIPEQTAADLALAREETKAIALRNPVGAQAVDLQDADIEIGYMAAPYDHSSDTLDTSGWPNRPYNAVRVTVLRDESRAGGPLSLFFGKVLGTSKANIRGTATAVVAMGTVTPRGDQDDVNGGLLPFTYQVNQWNALMAASRAGPVLADNGVSIALTDNYAVDPQNASPSGVRNGADGRWEVQMFPNDITSGNFGTINFSKSKTSNSTNTLRDLIQNGPNVADWPDLAEIVTASPTAPIAVNGDPGISAGMESAVEAVVGQTRIIPLYSTASGTGNNTFYQIVGFAPVTIVDVDLHGGVKYITIQPAVASYKSLFDGSNRLYFDLTPSATPNPLFLGARSLVR